MRKVGNFLVFIWVISVCAVLVLSLIPYAGPPPGTDKLVHVLVFAFLSSIPLLAFRRQQSILISLAIVVGVGFVGEAGQMLVPGREASLLDMGANLIGVALGIAAGLLLTAAIRRTRPSFENRE